jgi:dTDP-4-dehydrorhamnose reductase
VKLLVIGGNYDETHPPDPVTPYGAAKAGAETAVKGIAAGAVIARTSLIIGDGDSQHERLVHALAAGARGALFTDEVRCPVCVTAEKLPEPMRTHNWY